ncbi:GYDIA family GHMP kinase [Psychroserpens sp.]|uniref:GYDIA family GHMP kinase n=1 Tax=Psychroserpens sp. TaxID=2020870 RepID=UPI001B144A65|nr:GYDIA family GHMP kinase [Psychroserpens sp.]MBO6605836.1 hypothetical protein [Psychroserpens sp.]MBO6630473.1 hypothetical protein [Psychroserpens sp.]MBO6652793.1 hypothetical protein [Psychroserpens sp.]MBO6681435.1 hypothetical protein [Psychroserpens sp.]MBO6749210.1 hypothetical protein [Psychroserpens sp.]
MDRFYSHGKLMLTGEYVVLDGAKALALPTSFGQHMTVRKTSEDTINWVSKDHSSHTWFHGTFEFRDHSFSCSSSTNTDISDRLISILNKAYTLNTKMLDLVVGTEVTTLLEFPQDWGLGSSSTLINNIATWLNINPYELLELTFGGSGYDIACASASEGITFQLIGRKPKVSQIEFDPIFKSDLYFVHLNEKQDSREGILHYRNTKSNLKTVIAEIDTITDAMIKSSDLKRFQDLIDSHEMLISRCIQLNTVKARLFPDFEGSIKSLGAWGGDFILVASASNPKSYFESKGFPTILNYDEMILNKKALQ